METWVPSASGDISVSGEDGASAVRVGAGVVPMNGLANCAASFAPAG